MWIPALAFLGVVGATWGLYREAAANMDKRRILRRLLPEEATMGGGRFQPGIFMGFPILVGQRLLPKDQAERDAIGQRLSRAGFQADYAPQFYYGLRAICGLVLGAVVFAALGLWRGLSGQTLVLAYAALMLGYYAPRWGLGRLGKEQARRIVQELPDALDILLVCMNAGLSFDRALLRVSRDMRYVAPVLSKEFERYFHEVDSGLARRTALANLAERNQVNALTSVIHVLLQSLRFGTDIGQALRVHADGLRTERKQLAEERAAKVSTKLVLPTVLFIMPALLIMVLGPTGIRLLERARTLLW